MSEEYFPGGIYFEGKDESRTDVCFEESQCDDPKTIDLKFVTGIATFCLAACLPSDIKKLGKWMVEIANDVARRSV